MRTEYSFQAQVYYGKLQWHNANVFGAPEIR